MRPRIAELARETREKRATNSLKSCAARDDELGQNQGVGLSYQRDDDDYGDNQAASAAA